MKAKYGLIGILFDLFILIGLIVLIALTVAGFVYDAKNGARVEPTFPALNQAVGPLQLFPEISRNQAVGQLAAVWVFPALNQCVGPLPAYLLISRNQAIGPIPPATASNQSTGPIGK